MKVWIKLKVHVSLIILQSEVTDWATPHVRTTVQSAEPVAARGSLVPDGRSLYPTNTAGI